MYKVLFLRVTAIALEMCLLIFCPKLSYGQNIESNQPELTVLIAKALIDVKNGKTITNPEVVPPTVSRVNMV